MLIEDGQKNSASSSGQFIDGYSQNGQKFQDGISYLHWDNSHSWTSGTNNGGTANLYDYNICDGDNFSVGDTGNFIEDNGSHYTRFNLDIGMCGQLDSQQGSSTSWPGVTNNTVYNGFGHSFGNFNVQTGANVVKRNLFVNSADPFGQQGSFQSAVTAQATFASQDTLSIDYNGFFNAMGSSDTDPVMGAASNCAHGSPTVVPCPLPNAAKGTLSSYAGIPIGMVRVAQTTSTSGTSTTEIDCSTCNFTTSGVIPGDYVSDNSSGTKLTTTVASVASATRLLLTGSITGLTSGHLFIVYKSYGSLTACASGCFYGVTAGFGTHDFHVDPYFKDPTRSVCNYYVKVAGGTAPCYVTASNGGEAGGFLRSTSISGTTVINDTTAGVNFSTLGITANNDWIIIYQGNTSTFRCAAKVTSLTSTQLTFSPACTGLTSGDRFSFITALRYMGQAMVSINGWDYTGAPTTPPTWAKVISIWRWVRDGFVPQNYTLKGAGDDGSDIGAVPLSIVHGRPDDDGWQ